MRSKRSVCVLIATALAMPQFLGCNNDRRAPPPAVDDTVGYQQPRSGEDYSARQAPTQERSRMSPTAKKVVVLAGAAALYYLYKKHKAKDAAVGVDGQYYLSKNGRVYYRDAEHRAHWVTPPPGGIQVPESEADDYRQFQGYNNQPSGRDLTGLADESY